MGKLPEISVNYRVSESSGLVRSRGICHSAREPRADLNINSPPSLAMNCAGRDASHYLDCLILSF
jgi:hypothetical protein